jgi:gamma-glutamyltranspeptidase/glutathione hydrolase
LRSAIAGVLALSLVFGLAPSAGASPTETGQGLAAATLDRYATEAAIQVMQSGGNAIDGAVAASATIGVTAPYTCGIGGGGFMLIFLARAHRVVTVDHRETAPRAVTPTLFLDADGQPIPYAQQVTSGLSIGVPGLVRGWELALGQYGRLTLADDLQPAIDIAEAGFEVNPTFAAQTAANGSRFAAFTSTRDLFLHVYAGSIFRNPDLARTYRMLAHGGAAAFYDGPLAQAIVDTIQNPPLAPGLSRAVRPGQMQLSDLAEYAALFRPPVITHYRDLTVYGMDLPSSGGPTVGLALNVLDGFDLASMLRPRALHYLIEAERLAFADRNAYMADPAFVPAPLAGLLSPDYAAERRQSIGPRASSGPAGAGDPGPGREGTSTTHITVADAEGNVVAYTCTIEEIGGSGIVVPGYGFLLNNELTDFDDDPTSANAPDAGKRPRSSMSPTLVVRGDQPLLALGSPGGPTIITTVLQVLVNVVDFGMDLSSAVAAPRLSQRNLATTAAEPALSASPDGQVLVALGHRLVNEGLLGAVSGIIFNADGSRTAVAEPERVGGGFAHVLEAAP